MATDVPLAEVGREVVVSRPWWRKGLGPCRAEIIAVCTYSPSVTVKPLEGNPHSRMVNCDEVGVRWPYGVTRFEDGRATFTMRERDKVHVSVLFEGATTVPVNALLAFADEYRRTVQSAPSPSSPNPS